MQLQSATALVTGAGGFIGGHVARRLALEEGMAVRALVRNPAGRRVVDLDVPGLHLVVGDLTDPPSLQAAAKGVDLVVHAAADLRLRHEAVTRAVTVEGTRQMLLAAQRGGAQTFIHLSSIAVYGGGTRGDEDAPLVPYGDRYGDAKIGAELALWQATSPALRVAILRPPPVYGPGSIQWTMALARLVAGGWPACVSGGQGLFPHVYIDNLVDAVVAAAAVQAAPARAYNVVDGMTTWATYLGYFARAYGRPVRSVPSWPLYALALLAEGYAALTRQRSVWNRAWLRFLTLRSLPGYTAERANKELGWQPRISLEEGMARSLEWLKRET